MRGHDNSPTPPTSEDGSSEDSSDYEPRYTPEEIGALFLDFYKFLTTLHYDEADLKVPPPGGWPHITPESCAHFKSDYAIEVVRHLPYFDSKCTASIHYKSHLLDFTALTLEDYERHKYTLHEGQEFWSDEREMDPSDVVCIAEGYESYGRQLWLNVMDCDIIENMVRADMLTAVPAETFFDNLKEQFQTLKLIPGRGRVTIEADRTPEREGRITEEEVFAQTEDWGTELDIQYVRQIYRQHGWPDSFCKEEAFKAVDDWNDAVNESRHDWEQSS
ncbi:hypothetical protein G7Z17_g1806 [Cylindrodendrum hubeiense]|uniref:Uncharacterized protein n=1 Tax=Cylindrodendrum hubeiense TaxID=595255 RepID=A0A9P5HIV6_9HYPO|nr:hypothetical protein G7Z17_g1806 [Cylindrodendrum hubeiense]